MMHGIYAVLGKFESGKYECYCLNDNTHFESNADFLKKRTKVAKQGIPDLLDIVKKRYDDKCIKVLYNLRYVTKYE